MQGSAVYSTVGKVRWAKVAGAVGAAREVDRTEPLKEPSNGRSGPPEYPRNIREMMRGGARLALAKTLPVAPRYPDSHEEVLARARA